MKASATMKRLPTLDQQRDPRPMPKGLTRLQHNAAASRADQLQMQHLRNAVWKRDGAKCRACGRKVFRMLDLLPERGEVHHRRGRRVAPEHRYSVDQCVLLCRGCHERAQRHEITV